MTREQLGDAVVAALRSLGGTGTIVQVAERLWGEHEAALRASGDLFFTWQYDIRWAAQRLRDRGKLTYSKRDGRNVWQLV